MFNEESHHIQNMPDDFIFCFYESFEDELCGKIITFIERNYHSFIKEHHRRALDKTKVYVNSDAKHQLLQNFHKDTEAKIYETIIFTKYQSMLSNINNLLPIPIPFNIDSGYNLRKFDANERTRFHMDGTDVTQDSVRTLSVITYLNDDFDGGELVFPCQNRTIIPKKGMTIMFPPYWTHPHHANPVDAPRYTINTWFKELNRGCNK